MNKLFRLTQGTFSYLPDFTDEEIKQQIQYCLDKNFPVNIEYTDDPHPRNVYWSLYGLPMFDVKDAAGVMLELTKCRKENPDCYIRINAFDRGKGRQVIALSFIVNRPKSERKLRLIRQESHDRVIRYTIVKE